MEVYKYSVVIIILYGTTCDLRVFLHLARVNTPRTLDKPTNMYPTKIRVRCVGGWTGKIESASATPVFPSTRLLWADRSDETKHYRSNNTATAASRLPRRTRVMGMSEA